MWAYITIYMGNGYVCVCVCRENENEHVFTYILECDLKHLAASKCNVSQNYQLTSGGQSQCTGPVFQGQKLPCLNSTASIGTA